VNTWAARIGPVLACLGLHAETPILFDPGPDTEYGRRAFGGMWHYDMTRNGVVERDAPAKNERLFADAGDAISYAVGALRPSRPQGRGGRTRTTKTSFSPYTYANSTRRDAA